MHFAASGERTIDVYQQRSVKKARDFVVKLLIVLLDCKSGRGTEYRFG
jgi:hypothetical protein